MVDIFQVGCIFDNHHLTTTHHRHLTCKVDNLTHIAILAVYHNLVEGALLLGQKILSQQVGEGVDKVTLLAHQEIDRGNTTRQDIALESVVQGYRILEF